MMGRAEEELDRGEVIRHSRLRIGYLRQEIADGSQPAHDDPWNPAEWATPLDAMIAGTGTRAGRTVSVMINS